MKRKTLTTALLAGLTGTVGIANMSNAVNINPDGLGEALIYPYYTVREGQNTLISVVNTTDQVKAVKVRFLEAENSREVLDFNLFLSPFDVWTAAVIDNGTGAAFFSTDISCTLPDVPNTAENAQPFLDFRFTGDFADGGSSTLDRTREGYLELLEMGVVTNPTAAAGATHAATGPDCSGLLSLTDAGVTEPVGGLFGGATIVDVLGGKAFAYNARALDDWRDSSFYTGPGDETPRLSDANSQGPTSGLGEVESRVFYQGTVVTSQWSSGAEAVSAVFMHDAIMNEFVLDEGTQSGTDWVVNFPTKRFFTDPVFSIAEPPVAPFTTVFDGTACEAIDITPYDREENTVGAAGPIFSPAPPQGSDVLCFEANVLTFNGSSVLGSALDTFSNIPTNFENGWVNIAFNNTANSMTSNDADTYFGLPVTGFAVQTYDNETLTDAEGTNVLSVYGALFDHRASRCIDASAEAATCG